MKAKFNLMAIITAIVVSCCFASCNKEYTEYGEVDSEYYTVNLGMGGDILEVIETPLTRAGETADLYGIQVYSAPNKELPEGERVTWTRYAYGVFGSDENISINLLKGKKYKFEATMIVDGQNKVKKYSAGFSYPFYVSGTNGNFGAIGELFNYQHADYLGELGSGYTYLKDGKSYSHPNVERFYGELEDFVPGKNNDKALIKMKRTSFGAKFIAKGKLATEGQLEIQMTSAPKMMIDLSTNDKKVDDIFTFSNVKKAYQDNDHTETIAVTINWHRADGTVFPLGTHDITFKRNKMSTVQVKIETENAEGELGLEIDDNDMSDDDDVTNIEDGEIVDTNVDTNA